jgi:hypothetical protein
MGGPVFNEPIEGIDDGIKGYAVRGLSSERGGYGVIGRSDAYGYASSSVGVYGESNSGVGVRGFSSSGVGMWGSSYSGLAVIGICNSGAAVYGSSNSNYGVRGGSFSYTGVSGASDMGTGVDGISRSGYIRKDPWANANQIQVEEYKPAKEQGYYIYPDLYGQPEEKGINRLLFPEEEKWQEQLINKKKKLSRI